MRRRSNTKQPHDPHVLYLDEDVSGKKFAGLLVDARLTVLHSVQKIDELRQRDDELNKTLLSLMDSIR